MTTSTPEIDPGWCGWARKPRGRWRRLVVGARTDREAMEALRELTSGELVIDLCALRAGVHPNDPIGGED